MIKVKISNLPAFSKTQNKYYDILRDNEESELVVTIRDMYPATHYPRVWKAYIVLGKHKVQEKITVRRDTARVLINCGLLTLIDIKDEGEYDKVKRYKVERKEK